jgi:hypothetical protein
VLLAADPERRWAALCEASVDSDGNGRLEVSIGTHGQLLGDRLQQLLIDARGTRIPIERLLGATGERYVAFVSAEQLWLLDLKTTTQRQLSQSGKKRRRGLVVAVDSENGKLAHVEQDQIVLHDLVSDQRQTFPAPDGLVRRLDFEADGQVLSLEVVTSDSNGNGRLDAPRVSQGIADSPCQGPIPNYAVSGQHSDSADVYLIHLATGQMHAAPGFVMVLGKRWIRRGPERELVLEARIDFRRAAEAGIAALQWSHSAHVRRVRVCATRLRRKVRNAPRPLLADAFETRAPAPRFGGVRDGQAIADRGALGRSFHA